MPETFLQHAEPVYGKIADASINRVKIWLISDTHNRHRELTIPDGIDVVIHCGDESDAGDPWINELEAREFIEWYSELNVAVKILVPGNHSTAIEHGLIIPDQFPSVKFLIHSQTEIDGLTIFGTPYTPKFFNWAYMRERQELDSVWATIPNHTDILISHGPPKGILDVTRDFETREPIHVGSNSLTKHVKQRIRPMLHAFGHIHDEKGIRNFGAARNADTLFVNCSCCNIGGQLVNHGLVLDIDPPTRSIRSYFD